MFSIEVLVSLIYYSYYTPIVLIIDSLLKCFVNQNFGENHCSLNRRCYRMETWCFLHSELRITGKKFTLRSMPALLGTPLVLFIPETLTFELVS